MTPSSTSNPMTISLKLTRGPFVSSELQDAVLSKVAEWKPFSKFQSFQERQRSVRVSETERQLSELHEELKRAKEERSRALEEIFYLKRVDGKSVQSIDKIRLIEVQAETAVESERKMLDSMVHQTKELEQTKILLEEAKLEIRCLQESIRMIEDLVGINHQNLNSKETSESAGTQQEILQLRNDLRLALEAEENSKKAMDDLAIALIEVTAEANQAKAELASRQSDLEKAREEAESGKLLLKNTEQKLLEALNVYDKMMLEYEESVASCLNKEVYLLNCLRMSEEELAREKQENNRVNIAWKAAREENVKMRDIIKQAVNEASMVKEALENALNDNSELKNELIKKENSLQQARQDYESVKVSEGAALDCVKELKCLFASTSSIDSKKTSSFADVESFRFSRGTSHNAKTNKCLRIFPSERWKHDYHPDNNGHRHSKEEPGVFNSSDKDGTHETKKITVSSRSSLFDIRVPLFRKTVDSESDVEMLQIPDTVSLNSKKKKAILGRLGDTLRRRSMHN